jgi:hypothetical protein
MSSPTTVRSLPGVKHNVRHKKKKHLRMLPKCFIFSVPGRVRTVDPLIEFLHAHFRLLMVVCSYL